jgi:hypothetical protein
MRYGVKKSVRVFVEIIGNFANEKLLCENVENLSCKNLALTHLLALCLLKAWHADGMDGMDRNGGDMRQMGHRLHRENRPRAALAAVGFSKLNFWPL